MDAADLIKWRAALIRMSRELPALLPHACVVGARGAYYASALGLPDDDSRLCEAFGLLHDSGKVPSLRHSGFHPLDGARYIASRGDARLAALVAHHSGAAYEAALRGIQLPFYFSRGRQCM